MLHLFYYIFLEIQLKIIGINHLSYKHPLDLTLDIYQTQLMLHLFYYIFLEIQLKIIGINHLSYKHPLDLTLDIYQTQLMLHLFYYIFLEIQLIMMDTKTFLVVSRWINRI